MKEYWVNVYDDYYFGTVKHTTRYRASICGRLDGAFAIYRIHVKMKDKIDWLKGNDQ